MTRQEAIAQGVKTYIGAPCRKRGHGGKRYVSDASCVECKYARGWAKRNPASHHKPRIVAAPAKPMPSPHVIESDWLKPPTKQQLMARR
jgi:hypothetical protein